MPQTDKKKLGVFITCAIIPELPSDINAMVTAKTH